MPFYVYAWIGAIFSGLIVVSSKLLSKHAISNPWLFNFAWTLIGTILVIPVALLAGAGLPTEWISIFAIGFFAAMWYICYILAIYKLDVTVVAPLFNFRTIFAVILGMIFWGETMTQMQFILFILILVAGMFTSIDERFSIKSFFTPAIGIGILAMLFLAINSALTSIAVANNGVWTTNLWSSIISLIFVSFTFPLFRKDIYTIKRIQILPIVGIGLLQLVTNYAMLVAFAQNVGISSIIVSLPLSMIFAFVFSIFAPKLLEDHSKKVYAIRFTAAAIMIISAFFIQK